VATEVYTTEEVRLLDETEVDIRPLPIVKLRKFHKFWGEHMADVQKALNAAQEADDETFDDAGLTDAQWTTFIKMCALGLETQLKGEKTEKQFTAYLEEVLDEHTIYRMLKVFGNLELGNQRPTGTMTETGLTTPGTI
jgi:hypothetical protein